MNDATAAEVVAADPGTYQVLGDCGFGLQGRMDDGLSFGRTFGALVAESERTAALPESWNLTSDSLAAWLAGALGASRLVLVKHGRFDVASIGTRDLAARGIVDPLFPHYLEASGVRACLAGPADSSRLAEGLRRPLFPEIVVEP